MYISLLSPSVVADKYLWPDNAVIFCSFPVRKWARGTRSEEGEENSRENIVKKDTQGEVHLAEQYSISQFPFCRCGFKIGTELKYMVKQTKTQVMRHFGYELWNGGVGMKGFFWFAYFYNNFQIIFYIFGTKLLPRFLPTF